MTLGHIYEVALLLGHTLTLVPVPVTGMADLLIVSGTLLLLMVCALIFVGGLAVLLDVVITVLTVGCFAVIVVVVLTDLFFFGFALYVVVIPTLLFAFVLFAIFQDQIEESTRAEGPYQ